MFEDNQAYDCRHTRVSIEANKYIDRLEGWASPSQNNEEHNIWPTSHESD
jgi:hypothetical protein